MGTSLTVWILNFGAFSGTCLHFGRCVYHEKTAFNYVQLQFAPCRHQSPKSQHVRHMSRDNEVIRNRFLWSRIIEWNFRQFSFMDVSAVSVYETGETSAINGVNQVSYHCWDVLNKYITSKTGLLPL